MKIELPWPALLSLALHIIVLTSLTQGLRSGSLYAIIIAAILIPVWAIDCLQRCSSRLNSSRMPDDAGSAPPHLSMSPHASARRAQPGAALRRDPTSISTSTAVLRKQHSRLNESSQPHRKPRDHSVPHSAPHIPVMSLSSYFVTFFVALLCAVLYLSSNRSTRENATKNVAVSIADSSKILPTTPQQPITPTTTFQAEAKTADYDSRYKYDSKLRCELVMTGLGAWCSLHEHSRSYLEGLPRATNNPIPNTEPKPSTPIGTNRLARCSQCHAHLTDAE